MTKDILDKIKILSANGRGLKDKLKRFNVLNYLQNTEADIICLQDTHLTPLDSPVVKTQWNGDFIRYIKQCKGCYFSKTTLNIKF